MALSLLAVGVARVQAGPIFLPGQIAEGRYAAPEVDEDAPQPRAGIEPFGYEIRYATISANVAENEGSTTVAVDETIYGPKSSVSTVCIVPLVNEVRADSVLISAGPNSRSLKPLAGVRVLDAKTARPLLEGIVRTTGDVGFAAITGRPIAIVDAYELAGRTSFRIEYSEEPRMGREADGGVARLTLPLPRTQWSRTAVERLSITTTVDAAGPTRAVFSPTHRTEIERRTLRETVARVRVDDVLCEEDYELLWVADESDLGLRVLPFRMEGEDDGYFMVVANPTGREDGSDVLEKDVTFVLDTSGSMRGEKIEQCRAAISYCLDELDPGDRFNIVTFGSEIGQFRREHAPNTPEQIEAANNFVDSIVARGRTNIDGALRMALRGGGTDGRPRITIFLTDGTPTAGELVPERILEVAEMTNVSKSPVYVLGVGHDVNVHLLDKLAESTEGAAEFVEPEEEIDVQVAALYDRLAHPVLTDVAVNFEGVDTHSLFPRKLPAMYRNTQIMLFGRYREGGETTLTVSGTLAGEKREYTVDFAAPAVAESNANDYVAPLWASRKIGYLLQEMRLHGEDPELLQEVVRLSKKYGIITEYTQFVAMRSGVVNGGGRAYSGNQFATAKMAVTRNAFGNQLGGGIGGAGFGNEVDFARLNRRGGQVDRIAGGAFGDPIGAAQAVDLGAELSDEAAVREVTRQLAMARKQETGRWAFNQAKNDKDLQSRVVTTGVGNSYVDRRGQKVALDQFVKHVGGRCFFLKNGQWCESEEQGERKERVVKLYSKEYFDLLKTNEDFRRAQKLGWAISINIGEERVVVEKDGKRSTIPEPPEQSEKPSDQQGVAPNAGPVLPQLQNVIPQRAEPQPQINRLQQQKIEAIDNVRRRVR